MLFLQPNLNVHTIIIMKRVLSVLVIVLMAYLPAFAEDIITIEKCSVLNAEEVIKVPKAGDMFYLRSIFRSTSETDNVYAYASPADKKCYWSNFKDIPDNTTYVWTLEASNEEGYYYVKNVGTEYYLPQLPFDNSALTLTSGPTIMNKFTIIDLYQSIVFGLYNIGEKTPYCYFASRPGNYCESWYVEGFESQPIFAWQLIDAAGSLFDILKGIIAEGEECVKIKDTLGGYDLATFYQLQCVLSDAKVLDKDTPKNEIRSMITELRTAITAAEKSFELVESFQSLLAQAQELSNTSKNIVPVTLLDQLKECIAVAQSQMAGANLTDEQIAAITATLQEKANEVNDRKSVAGLANLVINEIQVSNLDMYVDDSFNYCGWVEFYNPSRSKISLDGCYISDDRNELMKYQFPSGFFVAAKSYAVLYFGHNNTTPTQANFDLDPDGGSLYMCNSLGTLFLEETYPECVTRASWARTTDGADAWSYTGNPTKGKNNRGASYSFERLPAPEVDRESGIHTTPFTITVTSPEGCTLCYTDDGSVPTLTNGTKTDSRSFEIGRSTVIYRFRLFQDGYLPSPVTTRSYIYSTTKYTVPVVSLVTDKRDLYSDSLGIMVRGTNGIYGLGEFDVPANWNREWDRVANMQYILPNGKVVVDQEGMISICGGWSRAHEPHAFKFKADKMCEGKNSLDYQFFSAKPHLKHKTVQFRSGGNDNSSRLFDPIMMVIIQTSGINVECQSYQPVVHFINGVYKGVINAREPTNKQYVRANYHYEPDELDQFEYGHGDWIGDQIPAVGYVQMCGTKDALDSLRVYTKKCADEAAYDEVCRRIDMDEFINYMAIQIFLNNNDWMNNTNNLKAWCPRTDDGRFRIVLYDLDSAFGGSDTFSFFASDRTIMNNSTGMSTEFDIVNMFRDLCANPRFRRQFIDSYCLVAGSVFNPKRSGAIADSLAANVSSMLRLEGRDPSSAVNSVKNNLTDTRTSSRMDALENFSLLQAKSLKSQRVTLIARQAVIKLFVNNLPVPTNAFSGRLYGPVTIRAEVPAGYRFLGWYDNLKDKNNYACTDVEWTLPEGQYVYAVADCERIDDGSAPLRINEVCADNNIYVNEWFKYTDWLEIYNTTTEAVDLAGMRLTAYSNLTDGKDPISYVISAPSEEGSTIIPARGYRIIWCDNNAAVKELHAPFKLDVDSGMVILTAADKTWSDTLTYAPHGERQSVGLFPDGGTKYYTFASPTIDGPNRLTDYAITYDESSIRTRYVTAVDVIEPDEHLPLPNDDTIYDLMGRKVLMPGGKQPTLDDLMPGVYLIHGKKYLVR